MLNDTYAVLLFSTFLYLVLSRIFICYSFNWLLACRCIKGEPAIEEYYEMYLEAERCSNEILETVMQSSTAQQFLTPGRVVVVKSQTVSNHNMVNLSVFIIIPYYHFYLPH